jgi:serine/threonine protein kinase
MVRAIHASLIGEFFGSWNVCFTLMDDVTTIAHEAAYNRCGILHRDISPSNILISEENEGGGLLIDWDLCKIVNSTEHKARCAARMVRIECFLICTAVLMNWNQGTWQFMAADLIANPRISQTFVHDLESAFYIMFWLSLKYLPNSYDPSKRGSVLSQVFNPIPLDSPLSWTRSSTYPDSLHNHGSDSKANWMANSEDVNHFKVTGNDPLSCLLVSLKNMLGPRHYSANIIDVVINQLKMAHPLENLDNFREKFIKNGVVEYSRVLDVLNVALREQWPDDDSAQLQRIELPPDAQISSLSGSKRSRSMFFASHNSQPVHSEPVRSSNSK